LASNFKSSEDFFFAFFCKKSKKKYKKVQKEKNRVFLM